MIRRLLGLDLADQALSLSKDWQALACKRQQEIDDLQAINSKLWAIVAAQELGATRMQRDLIVQFLEALDKPDEEELRAGLFSALNDLSDQVARLEEQVC